MTSLSTYNPENQLSHMKTLARIAFESKQYANMSEVSLLNLMLTAQDLGVSPLKAINSGFYIVNGKVCMSTSLMADKIRRAGHSIKIIEMTKEKCVIIAKRKDNEDSIKLDYTWEEATTAGLINSPTWKKFPKIMLYNRCMSQVARILFSDVIGNVYSEEERFDIQGVPADKRPLEDAEADIVVSAPAEDPVLTEAQCAELDDYIAQDPEARDKIRDTLNIENVYDMQSKDFDRTIKFLQRRKEQRENGQRTVA